MLPPIPNTVRSSIITHERDDTVIVNDDGSISATELLAHLYRRPPTEHRSLLNRALNDLMERALSVGSEEMGDDAMDDVYNAYAEFKQAGSL